MADTRPGVKFPNEARDWLKELRIASIRGDSPVYQLLMDGWDLLRDIPEGELRTVRDFVRGIRSGSPARLPEKLDPDAEICGLPYRVNIGGAAGPGAFVDDENVIKLIGFRRDWLRKHGINPDKCSLIDVLGNSMEPELRDKAIILIDHQRTRRLAGRIFAVRSDDGLQIKRLAHDNHDWLLASDNERYKPVRWPREAEVIGQVMWTGRTL